MQIFTELNKKPNLSLALGFFDGVHLGHKKVIKSAVDFAKRNGIKSAVVTFKEHPCCFFRGIGPKYILTREERLKHIGHFAITVKKEYWNMGIASMMMEEALEMIKETSLKVLDLEVKEDNLSAINLYKKFNFQEIGRYPQMFNVNQKYYDALLMNLYID